MGVLCKYEVDLHLSFTKFLIEGGFEGYSGKNSYLVNVLYYYNA